MFSIGLRSTVRSIWFDRCGRAAGRACSGSAPNDVGVGLRRGQQSVRANGVEPKRLRLITSSLPGRGQPKANATKLQSPAGDEVFDFAAAVRESQDYSNALEQQGLKPAGHWSSQLMQQIAAASASYQRGTPPVPRPLRVAKDVSGSAHENSLPQVPPDEEVVRAKRRRKPRRHESSSHSCDSVQETLRSIPGPLPRSSWDAEQLAKQKVQEDPSQAVATHPLRCNSKRSRPANKLGLKRVVSPANEQRGGPSRSVSQSLGVEASGGSTVASSEAPLPFVDQPAQGAVESTVAGTQLSAASEPPSRERSSPWADHHAGAFAEGALSTARVPTSTAAEVAEREEPRVSTDAAVPSSSGVAREEEDDNDDQEHNESQGLGLGHEFAIGVRGQMRRLGMEDQVADDVDAIDDIAVHAADDMSYFTEDDALVTEYEPPCEGDERSDGDGNSDDMSLATASGSEAMGQPHSEAAASQLPRPPKRNWHTQGVGWAGPNSGDVFSEGPLIELQSTVDDIHDPCSDAEDV